MRVLVVDDNNAVRTGIRSLLRSLGGFSVCGEAADGMEAIEKARELRPDIVLMDVTMPRMDGLQAAHIIRQELPETKVIIVSQNEPAIVRAHAAKVHADAFIAKADLARELVPSLRQILNGHTTHPPQNGAKPVSVPWLAADGEMGALMRSTDWSETALGSPETWSPALRMMVKFLLANRFPQLLWWGPQFCCLYNDAYIPILGAKHPWAIGIPVREVWAEIWHVLQPLIETPYRGGPATWMEDIPLEINRSGFVEETHFTIAYSPVPDDTVPAGIGGVLATVHEITGKVIAERRSSVLRDLGARIVEPKSREEACAIAAETLARHPKDLPFVLLYLLDAKRERAHLASSTGVADEQLASLQNSFDLNAGPIEDPWPISRLMDTEEVQVVRDLRGKNNFVPPGPWSDRPDAAALVPIRSNISRQLAGFMIAGISSRLKFDENYVNFLELIATRIATNIANARAYEEERRRAEANAKFRAVFEQTTVFAGIMTNDGVIVDANKLCLEVCGYQAEQVLGKAFWETPWWRNFEQSREKIRAATPRAAQGVPYQEKLRYSWADGSEHIVDLALYPIRDEEGRVIFLHPTGVDITDLQRVQESYRKLTEALESEVRARTGELEKRNIDVLRQSELLRAFSQRLLQTQDEERRRIARELHDSAGQTLTILGFQEGELARQLKTVAPDLAKQMDEIRSLTLQLNQEIRTTSYLLHPPLLDEAGISGALQWYVEGFSARSGVAIRLEIAKDFGRLPSEMELAIFRIVQEALTNIHRHSGSKKGAIRITQTIEQVVLEIQDQGKGMSADKLAEIQSQGSGVGFRGMRERVHQLHGQLSVHSDSSGTKLTVVLPIATEQPSTEQYAAREVRAIVNEPTGIETPQGQVN